MTFIQPHKAFNFINGVIAALALVAFVATFFLVAGYNMVVNTNHNIAALKAELDQTGLQNTNFQNRIMAMSGSDAMAQAAARGKLVEDKNPHYVSAGNSNPSLTLR
jgi:cell division protein FtsB